MAATTVFRSIAALSYYNAALGSTAVEVLAGSGSAVRNASDLGTPGARYPTHVRVSNMHATQYIAALVADSGAASLASGGFTCLIPPLGGNIIIPLSQAMRVSVYASGANTPMSVEFGTIG